LGRAFIIEKNIRAIQADQSGSERFHLYRLGDVREMKTSCPPLIKASSFNPLFILNTGDSQLGQAYE
jgi:hypothetical protein